MANWIHDIEIKNFKSIRDAKIGDCRRVNVFIGYPNVGKSNILEAIGLLTFIRKKRPTGLKELIRLYRLTQLFHYFNIQEPAVINFNNSYSLFAQYEDEKYIRLLLEDSNSQDNRHSALIYSSALQVGFESLHSSQTNKIDDFSGRITSLETFNVKPYKFSAQKTFDKAFSALELKVPMGDNMFEVIINSAKIKNQFIELLKPYGLEMLINISASDITITPKIKDGIVYPIPFSLMADTLTRLIFFKTAIYSNNDSVLLFEEPEAHMFPPYISKFTSDVMYDDNSNQYFIATHSPFVINDFMENLKYEELSIYVVGYKKDSGETEIKRLSEEELNEIYQYGIDLFLNVGNFLESE